MRGGWLPPWCGCPCGRSSYLYSQRPRGCSLSRCHECGRGETVVRPPGLSAYIPHSGVWGPLGGVGASPSLAWGQCPVRCVGRVFSVFAFLCICPLPAGYPPSWAVGYRRQSFPSCLPGQWCRRFPCGGGRVRGGS